MNITDEAVEAAAIAFAPHRDNNGGWFAPHEFLPKLRAALEAAAPHVARSPMMDEAKAHAWDAGARMRRDEHGHVIADNPYSPAP